MTTTTPAPTTVTVAVPDSLFETVELPELPEGLSWEVKSYPENWLASLGADADIWELHAVDADGVTHFFDPSVNSDSYNVTADDVECSANYLIATYL